MANIKPLTKEEQKKRNAFVLQTSLFFLEKETFTDLSVLTNLLGYASKWGAKKGLEKLEKSGLIKHHKMETLTGQNIDLYGITTQGIYAITDPEKLPSRVRGFEPSRVSLLTLPHRIKTHQTIVFLMKYGFKHIRINDFFANAKKLPDAVVQNPENDQRSTIEIELTIKSKPRYEKIIKDYQKFIDNGTIRFIHWITDDERKKKHLEKIFEELRADQNHRIWNDNEFKQRISQGKTAQ